MNREQMQKIQEIENHEKIILEITRHAKLCGELKSKMGRALNGEEAEKLSKEYAEYRRKLSELKAEIGLKE